MPTFIQINDIDNVAVALHPAPIGTAFGGAAAVEEIPQGHKMALKDIAAGEMIMKYGLPIGHATKEIRAGQWVHTHNMATNLSGEVEYNYEPAVREMEPLAPKTFMGYRRKDGRAASRNEIWIIPTVGCVNDVAKTLVRENQDLVKGNIDGLYTFTHPFGCSQTGHDHAQTRRLLAALVRHPNAGAVLVLHLGGENPDGTYFGDHYKWRVMHSNGTPEEYITGHKPDFERFVKFAEALEMAIGNPMYHWSNAELHKYFGITEPLTVDNAREIWEKTSDMLQNDPNMSVRGLIRQSNVAFIGTTDDPIDSLEWHEKIAADPSIEVRVCPSYRPDKAININKEGFAEYIGRLAASVGKKELASAQEVIDALIERLEFFAKLGCRASDHGLNIAMQIHYSCYRNANERIFRKMGPDTGVDMIAQNTCGEDIARMLSALDMTNECPKTIIYSLNPADNEQIGTTVLREARLLPPHHVQPDRQLGRKRRVSQ